MYKNFPYLRDKSSIDKQLAFKRGHEVGFFAHQLFPGGIDIASLSKNTSEAIELTKQHVESETKVIYEATFVFNGVLVMVDILCLDEKGYIAYEVKSSLRISENYVKDACLQFYVLKNSLEKLEDLFLVNLSNDYILEKEVDPKKLFKRRSIKLKALENFDFFDHRIKLAHNLLEQNIIPNTAIGKQCFKPYLCDYYGSCWKQVDEKNSVFDLPFVDREQQFEWYNSGIKNLSQLKNEDLKNENLKKLKESFVTGVPIVKVAEINSFLSKIKKPVASMDMEIWSPAIPKLEGSKCFEQIPFLVSFFDGQKHSSYFCDHSVDNREAFSKNLIALSLKFESILVYDKTMEVAAINALSERFPDLKQPFEQLKTKLCDVFDIFLNLHYYHPLFKNNFSLKAVASALLKNITYTKVSTGMEAMNYYEQYLFSMDEAERTILKEELIEYCNTDCTAAFYLTKYLETL